MKIKQKCPCGSEIFIEENHPPTRERLLREWKDEHEECIDLAKDGMEKIADSFSKSVKMNSI